MPEVEMAQLNKGWIALLLVLVAPGGDRTGAAAEEARGRVTVARAWHGRTPTAKADEYEKYLGAAITKFTSIPGNLGYQKPRLPDDA